MAFKIMFAVALVFALAEAQRPFYAGYRPIGMPALEPEPDPLANRFGEKADMPILAKGDGNLINRLNQLPVNSQPFWYLNWRAYNELMNNPQYYQPKSNDFLK